MISTPTSPTASSTTSQTQCRYAGKRCYNPRATKRNGSLHSLCHVHRVRANQNQRRMEFKRRITRTRADGMANAAHAALYHALSSTSSSNATGVGMGDIDAHLSWIPPPPHMSSSAGLRQQQQLQVPDYSLNAFIMGSMLSDEGYFMDLDVDVFAKDASHVNMSVCLHEPQPITTTNGYVMYHQYQQQLQTETFHHSQSDMWIVPNFLLTP